MQNVSKCFFRIGLNKSALGFHLVNRVVSGDIGDKKTFQNLESSLITVVAIASLSWSLTGVLEFFVAPISTRLLSNALHQPFLHKVLVKHQTLYL